MTNHTHSGCFSFFSDTHPAWYEVYTERGLYHIYLDTDGEWSMDEYKEMATLNEAVRGTEPFWNVDDNEEE